jgi:hypothetical protein
MERAAKTVSLAVAEDLDDDVDDADTSLCSTSFPTTEPDESTLNPERVDAGIDDGARAKKYVVKVYLTKKNVGEGKSPGSGIGNDRKGSAAAAASVCATAVASSDEEVRLARPSVRTAA